MLCTDLLDPTTVETRVRARGDMAAATSARFELLALVAEAAAPKGYITTCTVAYQMPGQEFVQTHTLETHYAGIWAWFCKELGTELAAWGIKSLPGMVSTSSPIRMAFGRLMPGETSAMPDRVVTDGNSPDLLRHVMTAFSVAAATREGDTHDVDDMEMSTR